jgi:23S rRNA pseudouridine2605 synthase
MDIKYYLNKHKIQDRVFPVGRLDYDSSGLLILTNDGDLANKLMHPSYNINKEYQLIINGILNEKAKYRLENGIELEEGITSNSEITILDIYANKTKINIIIHQGWNRQIRRMFKKTGYDVISLKRTAIGNIKLSNLKPGNIRKISENLIYNLKS